MCIKNTKFGLLLLTLAAALVLQGSNIQQGGGGGGITADATLNYVQCGDGANLVDCSSGIIDDPATGTIYFDAGATIDLNANTSKLVMTRYATAAPSAACDASGEVGSLAVVTGTTAQQLYVCEETAPGVYNWVLQGDGGGAFSSLSGGTNTAAAMVVGTGASLAATGSGAITATAAPASGITGTDAGTDLTADLEEETHASEHQENGADELTPESLGTACTDGQTFAADATGGVVCSDLLDTSSMAANTVVAGPTSGPAAAGTVRALVNADIAGLLAISDLTASSSANLAGVLSDETGSGLAVFGTQPTIDKPVLGNYTVGSLPTPAANMVVIVTDGNSAGDCTTGGGSTRVFCHYTGSAWASLGDGGGSGCTVSGSNNQVVTDDGAGGCVSEANLTFDGSNLGVTGTIAPTSTINFPDGVRQTFNPDGTTPGMNVGSQAGDPSTPSNGDMWYNSSTSKFRCYENGAAANCIGAGSAPTMLDNTGEFFFGITIHTPSSADLTTGNVAAAQRLHAARFYLPHAATVNSLVFNVATGAGVGEKGEIGLYNADGSSLVLRTGTLCDTSTPNINSSGAKLIDNTVTNCSGDTGDAGFGSEFAEGFYWLAICASNTTWANYVLWTNASSLIPIINGGTVSQGAINSACTDGDLPATLATGSLVSGGYFLPIVKFQR